MKAQKPSTNIELSREIVVDLHGAWLPGVSLRGAKFCRARLSDTVLNGADLSRADLREASLMGASLEGANLSGADLSNADMRNANLVSANLQLAVLDGADLTGAKLRLSDLGGVDLSRANGLTFYQLREAATNSATRVRPEINEEAERWTARHQQFTDAIVEAERKLSERNSPSGMERKNNNENPE